MGARGHLKAIWLQRQDGGNPVETRPPTGAQYSFLENLDHGRWWKRRRLDRKDEDGIPFSTRAVFLQVVTNCLVLNGHRKNRRAVHRASAWRVQAPREGHR